MKCFTSAAVLAFCAVSTPAADSQTDRDCMTPEEMHLRMVRDDAERGFDPTLGYDAHLGFDPGLAYAAFEGFDPQLGFDPTLGFDRCASFEADAGMMGIVPLPVGAREFLLGTLSTPPRESGRVLSEAEAQAHRADPDAVRLNGRLAKIERTLEGRQDAALAAWLAAERDAATRWIGSKGALAAVRTLRDAGDLRGAAVARRRAADLAAKAREASREADLSLAAAQSDDARATDEATTALRGLRNDVRAVAKSVERLTRRTAG